MNDDIVQPLITKIPSPDFKEVIEVIRRNKSFLVCAHVNPDPDALSSQLAMVKCLQGLGKKVWAVSAAPIPKRFHFLPGIRMIKPYKKGARIPYDVAIVLDCGDFDRIGNIQELLSAERMLINIDHHITNELFGTLNILLPRASSTAEVLFDLFERMKFPITEEMAVLLYVGIMTDTGSFRYDNSTAHAHDVVARLMKFPIPVSLLYQILYETIPLNDIKYFTRLVGTFDFLFRGKVVCLELTKKIIKKFSEEFDLRDKIFRYFRAIKGVEVILILTEDSATKTRVNLRSMRKVDVGRLAYRFSGGGHSRASGCILEGNVQVAKKKILAEIKKVL